MKVNVTFNIISVMCAISGYIPLYHAFHKIDFKIQPITFEITGRKIGIYIGSNMSAHVLLNLLNELGK